MKRKRRATRDERAEKRRKLDDAIENQPSWPLLRCYYPRVVTLRQYLAAKLSKSKKRQRKLLAYGLDDNAESLNGSNKALVELLDTTIVGAADHIKTNHACESIDKDITLFTQLTQQLSGCTSTVSPSQGIFKQNEASLHHLFSSSQKVRRSIS